MPDRIKYIPSRGKYQNCVFTPVWIGTYKAGQPLYLKEGSFSLSKPLAIWC